MDEEQLKDWLRSNLQVTSRQEGGPNYYDGPQRLIIELRLAGDEHPFSTETVYLPTDRG